MLASWATEEMQTAKLKDARLNERLTKLLSDLGERPAASIPEACGGKNEIDAAYRFFDNEKATDQKILEPHYERTRERIAKQPLVLLIQDTTEFDFTRPKQQVEGAGPLDRSSRRGAFFHPLAVFSPDGTPLGSVWSKMWVREEIAEDSTKESASEKELRRRATPIEEKESFRWLEGLRHARQVAQEIPEAQCVAIADSEGDIYELFCEPRGERPVHWLVRASADRALQPSEQDEVSTYLRHAVESTSLLFTKEISVRGREPKVPCDKHGRRQPRQSRMTVVEVRATTVTLRPPRRPDRKLTPVTVSVIQVLEPNPPDGDEAVEWLLITTLPIDTIEQVRQAIQYYTVRFLIEVLFRVIKSGCRVEERRFEHIDRLLPCIALYWIIAWRTLMVCRLGRSCPDLDCEAIFDPSEWKSVWMKVTGQAPPSKPPRLAEMVKLIAQLGGYVNRPNRKDPPGPQTVWQGMQRMHDLAWSWRAFGPGATTPA